MLVAALAALGPAAAPAKQRIVFADPFSQRTAPLSGGQIELTTLSSPPSAVTGGDALVAVRGVRPGDDLRVTRNGDDVTGAFRNAGAGERHGLVDGLRDGRNRIVAVVRRPDGTRRRASLPVENHPVTGPVISGPHQEPFVCETEDAGLGPPLDDDCSIRTRVQFFYRSAVDQAYHELADPFAPYPRDVARTTTSRGERVPFVVRLESATINRGITRIAVLDDPRGRGRGTPFRNELGNDRLTYAFGESCGVGYHQGTNSPQSVLGGTPSGISADNAFASIYGLADRLGKGDVVAHSTMTTFGVYCNPLVSAETLMMVSEHVNERYGELARTVGVGGSGGALQQYNAANNYPGLLDAALPIATFTDIVSTAMTVVDCGLMVDYFGRSDMTWSTFQKAAVAGHATEQICVDWKNLFLSRLDPTEGCDGSVPDEIRYDAQRNPGGVRCTLQDATKNIWGTDPETGFAPRPYDNVGVQYGLRALTAGLIDGARFIDLNRAIGGYDLDADRQPERSAMTPATAHTAYRLGGVIGRGALDRTPIIDLATYLDLVPVADIHDVVRPFQVRARLRERSGTSRTQAIWRGVSVPSDAQAAIGRWADRVDARVRDGDADGADRARAVAATQPPAARDRCLVTAGGARADLFDSILGPLGLVEGSPGGPSVGSLSIGAAVPERQEAGGLGLCQTVFPARSGTRVVAGGPLSDDVLKCSLKPVDPADYAGRLDDAQLAELRRIFPGGVCDFSRPGVGEVQRSIQWPSIGAERRTEARSLRWKVARSR